MIVALNYVRLTMPAGGEVAKLDEATDRLERNGIEVSRDADLPEISRVFVADAVGKQIALREVRGQTLE